MQLLLPTLISYHQKLKHPQHQKKKSKNIMFQTKYDPNSQKDGVEKTAQTKR